jgi:hypothetical protein
VKCRCVMRTNVAVLRCAVPFRWPSRLEGDTRPRRPRVRRGFFIAHCGTASDGSPGAGMLRRRRAEATRAAPRHRTRYGCRGSARLH